jgi:hypothetical protein
MPSYPAEGTEIAFNVIVQAIRQGIPRAAVRAWDGDPLDDDGPGDDVGPWVRLTPSPLPSAFSNVSAGDPDRPVYSMPFSIAVETSTPGTSIAASFRLWGQIMNCLHPEDPAQLAALAVRLQLAGISRIEVKRPAWGVPSMVGKAGPGDVVRSYGVGSLEVSMNFGT